MLRRQQISLVLASIVMLCTSIDIRAYDPLAVPPGDVKPLDLSIPGKNSDRSVPVFLFLPANQAPAPVILFSHGLGGARTNNDYLPQHYTKRGYAVCMLQHPGSDESVWKDLPLLQRMPAMRRAANVENFQLRVSDVKLVLDQFELWNQQSNHRLHQKLDLKQVGMSGHSFGAVTTQAVSGQRFPLNVAYTDARIKAAVVMSPSAPRQGNAEQAFGQVKLPWLLLTGTNDVALIGDVDVNNRLAVYPALPPGDKYELVLHEAEHSAFTDTRLPGEKLKRNPNHHKAILAITTAFWDAYLKQDEAARTWLGTPDSVRRVLEPKDRWQTK